MTDPAECLGCSRLEAPDAATVVLLTGQTVCTYCPSWLAETRDREILARAILALPEKSDRLARLASYEAREGAEARARVEAVILAIWQRRRAAANPEPADAR